MFEPTSLPPYFIKKLHEVLPLWANWIVAAPLILTIIFVLIGLSLHIINRKRKTIFIENTKYLMFIYSCIFVVLSPCLFLVLVATHAFGLWQGIFLFLAISLFLVPFFYSIMATPVKVKKYAWWSFGLSIVFYLLALLVGNHYISL